MKCLDTCDGKICDCLTSDEMSNECFKLVGDACLYTTISTCLPTKVSMAMCPLVGCIAEADGNEAKLAVGYGGGDLPTDGNLCAAYGMAGECFSPDRCAAMDKETMLWDEPYADCNPAAACTLCFPSCGGGDGTVDVKEDMDKESTTMAPTGSPTNSPTMAPTGAPTKSPTKTTEDGAPTPAPIDDIRCGRVVLVLGWVVLALATAMIH